MSENGKKTDTAVAAVPSLAVSGDYQFQLGPFEVGDLKFPASDLQATADLFQDPNELHKKWVFGDLIAGRCKGRVVQWAKLNHYGQRFLQGKQLLADWPKSMPWGNRDYYLYATFYHNAGEDLENLTSGTKVRGELHLHLRDNENNVYYLQVVQVVYRVP